MNRGQAQAAIPATDWDAQVEAICRRLGFDANGEAIA